MVRFITLLLAMSVCSASDALAQQTQTWTDAQARQVTIPVAKNHAQCMANGEKMGYSIAASTAYCDKQFPQTRTATGAQALPDLKLPAGMVPAMTPPARNVPAEFAAFFGKWGGYWRNLNPSNLIIESVSPSGDVRAIYLYALAAEAANPQVFKVRGKIENNILTWGDAQRGFGYEFTMTDGKLVGDYFVKGNQQGHVVMSKMP